MNSQKLGFAVAIALFPQLSHADFNGVYVGAKAGWVHGHNACESHRRSCDNDELGAGAFVGYNLNSWLAIEAGYDYFGKMKAVYPALGAPTINAPYEGTVQGVELGLKPNWSLTQALTVFGKAGTLAWWTDVNGQEVNFQHHASNNGWSPMLGAGFEYALSKKWLARLEYQWFNEVGGSETGGNSINMLSAGIVYSFGSEPSKQAQSAPYAMKMKTSSTETKLIFDGEDTAFFDTNSYLLTTLMRERLTPALKYLISNKDKIVTIEGHTDNVGSTNYNQKLSELRAMAVEQFFFEQGIVPSRVTVNGMGESHPIASNDHESGRAKNRRIILMLSQGQGS